MKGNSSLSNHSEFQHDNVHRVMITLMTVVSVEVCMCVCTSHALYVLTLHVCRLYCTAHEMQCYMHVPIKTSHSKE